MIGWIEFLSALIVVIISCFGLATLVFAIIGISAVYRDYKNRNWQKQHGDKLEEETKRNRWEERERLSDRIFLLEEILRQNDMANNLDEIDRVVSQVDYDARYDVWIKHEAKWEALARSSMAGGLGSSEKAQADINEDFDSYEGQRKQKLREQLNKTLGKDR